MAGALVGSRDTESGHFAVGEELGHLCGEKYKGVAGAAVVVAPLEDVEADLGTGHTCLYYGMFCWKRVMTSPHICSAMPFMAHMSPLFSGTVRSVTSATTVQSLPTATALTFFSRPSVAPSCTSASTFSFFNPKACSQVSPSSTSSSKKLVLAPAVSTWQDMQAGFCLRCALGRTCRLLQTWQPRENSCR